MKASVCVKLIYQYEVDVPNIITDRDEIVTICDSYDPVMSDVGRIFYNNNISVDCSLVSIIDVDKNELIYEGD